MKTKKRILKCIFFIVIFVAIYEILSFLLVDDITNYTRIMMHELYSCDHNIDVLFVGSSHVMDSIIPEEYDKITGQYSFNVGTPAQQMDGSLVLIQEALDNNDIKTIYLETYYCIAEYPDKAERTQMTPTYLISDYMRTSKRKIDYLLEASSSNHYSNSFFKLHRSWKNAFSRHYFIEIFPYKLTSDYWEFKPIKIKADPGDDYYTERGFISNSSIVDLDKMKFENETISAPSFVKANNDWRKDLQKIIDLCKENNINLVLFSAPMPQKKILSINNYDEWVETVQTIANENGIVYYDFNYCKPLYFDNNEESYFCDDNHLNTEGAKKFTKLIAEMSNNIVMPSEVFEY